MVSQAHKSFSAGMITTILGAIVFLVIFAVVLRMIWNALEIAYRVIMIAFYSTAYVAITAWEVLVWVVLLPSRLARWIRGRQ